MTSAFDPYRPAAIIQEVCYAMTDVAHSGRIEDQEKYRKYFSATAIKRVEEYQSLQSEFVASAVKTSIYTAIEVFRVYADGESLLYYSCNAVNDAPPFPALDDQEVTGGWLFDRMKNILLRKAYQPLCTPEHNQNIIDSAISRLNTVEPQLQMIAKHITTHTLPKNQGGRKPDVFATEIVPRIVELRDAGKKWEIVTRTINREFGKQYQNQALQSQFNRKKNGKMTAENMS